MIYASFLRLLIKDALANKFTAPYPTLAQNNIYDTKISEVQAEKHKENLTPLILIYTDNIKMDGPQEENHPANFKLKQEIIVTIESFVFGGTGKLANHDAYLAVRSDALVTQIMDALFKTPNNYAERFQEYISSFSAVTHTTEYLPAPEMQTIIKTTEFTVKICDTYTSEPYNETILKFIDLYPEYKDLITDPLILAEVNKINVNNVEDKMNVIYGDIDSSGDISKNTITKFRVETDD
jgi:hypothetical protein